MKTFFKKIIVLLFFVPAILAEANWEDDALSAAPGVIFGGASNVLPNVYEESKKLSEKLSEILTKNNRNYIKGLVAESFSYKKTQEYLNQNGTKIWKNIAPTKDKGLDNLFTGRNNKGLPSGIYAVEAKYGTSSLSQTKTGIQGGRPWLRSRFIKLSNTYKNCAEGKFVEGGIPKGADIYFVHLRDGTEVRFSIKDGIHLDCAPERYGEVRQAMKTLAAYYLAAGEGRISVRSRLDQVIPNDEGGLTIITSGLDDIDSGNKPKKLNEIKLSKNESKIKNIEKELSRKLSKDLDEKELRSVMNVLKNFSQQEIRSGEITYLNRVRMWSKTIKTSAAFLGVGIALDVGSQFYNGQVDYAGTFVRGGITAGMLGATIVANSALRANIIGGIGLILISYSDYCLGKGSLQEANRNAVASLMGFAAGELFAKSIGVAAGFCSTAGAAGSGTAAAGTAGAAVAGSAAGTANASVGAGAAAGAAGAAGVSTTVVVTGGAFVVAVVVTGAVTYYFYQKDKKERDKQITEQINQYKDDDVMEKLIRQEFKNKTK